LSDIVGTIATTDNIDAVAFPLVGTFIIGIGILIWIRRGIKNAYIRSVKDNNNEIYQQKIKEKDDEIQRLSEFCKTLRMENHSINHRLAAMERGYSVLLEQTRDGDFTMELTEEIAISLEDVKRAALDYEEGIKKVKKRNYLPTTKIKMLDNLFELFAEKCMNHKIEFYLIINGSIKYMVENIIPQSKLETMIGDHLQDAIIAVNSSNNSFRSILVILGLADKCYALTVFDSGIPFEADTLTRLGTELVTTYAETGGNGIGFIRTFETMRECGASLIIAEKASRDEDYTKSVTIRFDSKNRYIIETYRPNEFPPGDNYRIKVI
jgi:hypothetical protein